LTALHLLLQLGFEYFSLTKVLQKQNLCEGRNKLYFVRFLVRKKILGRINADMSGAAMRLSLREAA